MKNGFLIFFASFVMLGGSWCGFVLAPVLQLGGQKQTTILNSSDVYPVGRPGLANQGLQVYRANGCAACHTEQVQQEGVACEVVLTSAGTNPMAVTNAMSSLKLTGLDKNTADVIVDRITAVGGKAEIHITATGPDIARGWGLRHSVAEDFLYDDPVQLGSVRIGPDLADVGALVAAQVDGRRPALQALLGNLLALLTRVGDAVDAQHFVHLTPTVALLGPAGSEPSIVKAA